ncbi:General secretion pathway protein K [Planctomycetes bacterium Poly30]|uniref:General secretion pathway protein K n=1 Tax=Saltatorellus ferox TaxID=2528018 RepID=A0A518ER39_9BACT|nr:General secretion pathway protein K [Planctomycetes bacterium Poly30]
MKTFHPRLRQANDSKRGAALLLAFLVLIVIIAIVYQIYTVTQSDARISRNEITRSQMDLAIRSAMLQVYEDLAEDGRAAMASEADSGAPPGGGGQDPTAGATDPAAATGEPGEPARNPDSVDSQMDSWYTPQSTNFEDIQIRIMIRDENSKYNVLNMLNPDEEVADAAYATVVRILDKARGDTDYDIGLTEAEQMADAMRQHMRKRTSSDLPRPRLLTESSEDEEAALPLSFAEFRALEPFSEDLFRDFFDTDDTRIHGIQSFLTIFTSPTVGTEEPGEGIPQGSGGFAVNVNTAPLAVLASLLESRDVSYRLWDEILEYRNMEEDPIEGEEEGVEEVEPEPMLDEYGEEILPKQIFDSLDELEEVFEFKGLLEAEKTKVRDRLQVTSDVFEIILAARISTASEAQERLEFDSRREQEEYFRSGKHLVRIVRTVIWRRQSEDDILITPLVPWEVIDNAPLQVLDYPDEDR